MRILVCGGRNFAKGDGPGWAQISLSQICFDLCKGHPAVIIEGGAEGYDRAARLWAQAHDIPVETYEADWRKNGRSAGPIRNRTMLEQGKPDLVIAFPGGKGTENMVKLAKEAGVEIIEVSSP